MCIFYKVLIGGEYPALVTQKGQITLEECRKFVEVATKKSPLKIGSVKGKT